MKTAEIKWKRGWLRKLICLTIAEIGFIMLRFHELLYISCRVDSVSILHVALYTQQPTEGSVVWVLHRQWWGLKEADGASQQIAVSCCRTVIHKVSDFLSHNLEAARWHAQNNGAKMTPVKFWSDWKKAKPHVQIRYNAILLSDWRPYRAPFY